jgi:hypothetical protein
MISGRQMSLASVVVMASLGAGFGAWSGFTNPQIAGVQLQIASENLAAVSSFTATVDETESVVGTAEVLTVREFIHHQGPDREFVMETTHVAGTQVPYAYTRTLTQIGDSCWTSVSGAPPGVKPLGCSASTVRVKPLSEPEIQSAVTYNSGTYSVSPTVAQKVLKASIGDSIGMVTFEVRIEGDYVSWEHVSFDLAISGATIDVVQTTQFGDFGSGPSVTTPIGAPTAKAG